MSGADSTTGPGGGGGGGGSSLQPLLETLEDLAATPEVLTDALLTLTNRLTGEEGKEFAAEVGKHFPLLCKIFKMHIPTENSELSSAALQALGFCVFNPKIASLMCEAEIQSLISIVNSVAIKSVDKNTRTRALWVISKQSFPPDVVGKLVPSIIIVLETVLNKGDSPSAVLEYEVLNVIIRLIAQAPSAMEEQAVRWAKLIIPLVVHSAHKVQLRGATALEMGVPLLLRKQQEVATVTEELMTSKIIPELQKLFSSKNETYVLKLWPLFVKLLGKALHRSGSFINSLLQLEELGFRSVSPVVKKIAFIAWKSLIDNFALNPDILCSAKRLKLLMQPLSSIHVRTEALALTKIEVWWYLMMRLGPQLPAHFEQVCIPLIQSTLSLDPSLPQGNSSRLCVNQSLPGSAQKSGSFISGASSSPRMKLNSTVGGILTIPSIQLLGIEMLLHFFMGPEVLNFAKENNIVLSLEPLQCCVISSPSFFCKHASTFINAIQDGFIGVGKEASDIILSAVWKEMIGFVRSAIESVPGSKRERQSSEVFTMLLKALKNIIMSNELPVSKSLSLIEITIKELPPKVLGSPAYQVADMDLLNGTPALFLIQLSFNGDLLKYGVQDERFFLSFESLVGFVLSGPSSPLAFSESVFTIVNQSSQYLENKEHLWRIWSIVVNPLTEWINQTNEVNQGDALEHNFSAMYTALLLPINHIISSSEFPQPTMKTLLRSWSELYRAFARCALLVATAEDNLCCEELCAKIISRLEEEACINQPMLDGLAHITSVMVDCINFAPYGTKYQPANKSPQTSTDWSKKKKDPLGKLSSLVKLLVNLVNSLQMFASKESGLEKLTPVGASVIVVLQNIIGHISLPSVIRALFAAIMKPLAAFYEKAKSTNGSKVTNGLNSKFEKMLMESISCLQSHYTAPFDSELLQELSPLLSIMLLNKNKHIRTQATQFWNATFGKAVTLIYPEELKPVLCQVRQKMILSLPGFQSTEIVEEFNGTCSDSIENSQWDSKISGIEVKPLGKRNSLLVQANELKENSVISHLTPTMMKVELPLLKTNRKSTILEEENTEDFVVIPPETKERVLTEHQKEVLRTKRVDIPTMYNTLDASQDTVLFSQYTQSQEYSLEKVTLVDVNEHGKKENTTIPQDEKATGDVPDSSHEASESCKADILLDKTNSITTEKPEKQNSDSNCEDSDKCSKKGAGEPDPSLNESTSNVSSSSSSSSSASSDVISGTPQPSSRRQSFITLEKFDSSDNRPFSSPTFSNNSGVSGSTPLLAKPENASANLDICSTEKPNRESKNTMKLKTEEIQTRTKKSCLEIIDALETYVKFKKAKDGNKASSKSQSESMPGIKRSSLRQNNSSISEDKAPELMQLEQEKNIEVAPVSHVEDKQDRPDEPQGEHLLDIRSQASTLNVPGSTVTENKQSLDSVAEIKVVPSFDSKENTPPEMETSREATSNVSQTSQLSTKTLRRSLRRRPEATEGEADSQDKENSKQKKEGHKEDERAVPKKTIQGKEAASQKQISVSEEGTDTQCVQESHAADNVISKEHCASGNNQEEAVVSTEKSEANNASDTEDLQDSDPNTTGEKAKGLPRYHTRRSSQGLLTSIENSESDSSETKEGGVTRRRSGRSKSKGNALGSQVKEELEGQDCSRNSQTAVEIQASLAGNKHVIQPEVHTDAAVVLSNSEEGDKKALLVRESMGLQQDKDALSCMDSLGTERKSTKRKATNEPSVENSQGTDTLNTDSALCSNTSSLTDVSEGDAYVTATASPSSEKLPEMSGCQHKRSKRTRRSKSCDCCGEKPDPPLEKLPAVLKKEHKKMPCKVSVALLYIPVAEAFHSVVGLDDDPCATSTPLIKDFVVGKDSSNIESDGKLPEEILKDELKDPPCIGNEKDTSFENILGHTDLVEKASEQSASNSLTKESTVSEVDSNPAGIQLSDTNQSSPSEDAEIDVKPAEDIEAGETVANLVQEAVEKATASSAAVKEEPQENEMVQEANAEDNVANIAAEPQTSASAEKENNNSDSPLKPKELDGHSLAKVRESPNGMQARCTWSPSASPSTSILKRGVKRQQEEDSPSPANKSRRVSFANPIYQEELADDIDRRSPVVRNHSNGSQSFRSTKPSPVVPAKPFATPVKGSLSPGSRSHRFKSSKKCLITEMVKEPLPSPTESIYPALVGCKAPVDTILPQITSNIWARGLGQLIRAKNIRTVGDLSSLSAAEIKTLPIRSPKVTNVRRALKGYHEQQVKSRGSEEIAGLDEAEKAVNGIDEKPSATNEDNDVTDSYEPAATMSVDEPSATDLCTQINSLSAQMTSEELLNYSVNELFEIQEKLHYMTAHIMKTLQTRWKSPSQESIV